MNLVRFSAAEQIVYESTSFSLRRTKAHKVFEGEVVDTVKDCSSLEISQRTTIEQEPKSRVRELLPCWQI